MPARFRLTIPEFAPTEAKSAPLKSNSFAAASRFLNSRRLKRPDTIRIAELRCPRLTIPEFAPTEAGLEDSGENGGDAASRFLNSRRLKHAGIVVQGFQREAASRFLNSRRLKLLPVARDDGHFRPPHDS